MRQEFIQNQKVLNFPDDIKNPPRRKFIKQLIGGLTATATISYISCGKSKSSYESLKNEVNKLSDTDIGNERFWNTVVKQFPIRQNLIIMNTANLSPSPHQVQEAIFEFTRDEDSDPSFTNREKFNELRENARIALAEFLGAKPDEIAIVRNTTEGNNTVINGLTLKKGDEVVIWDQNHPTNNIAWDVRAEKYGFTVNRVKTIPVPQSYEDLIKPFHNALTKNTKVLAFSHVSNISGVALPAKELCKMAREYGILTLADGAQTFGERIVNLSDMGCDFYTGSSHKWLCGPKELGVLYVRSDMIEKLFPSIVGAHWEDAVKGGARKFESFGQRDDAKISAMNKAVEFNNIIGKNRIEKRVRYIATALKSEIKKKIPNVKFHTPLEPEFSSGVVVFTAPGIDLTNALNTLYHKHNLGCAIMVGDFAGIRLSPHIYNSIEEIERAVDAVSKLV